MRVTYKRGFLALALFCTTEEDLSGEKRVIGFQGANPDENQQQQRRHDDCIDQCQSLPDHVHKHRNDQSRFEHHKDNDQKPAQVTFELKIVDRLGESAQYEQQNPDLEINTEWVLLTFC